MLQPKWQRSHTASTDQVASKQWMHGTERSRGCGPCSWQPTWGTAQVQGRPEELGSWRMDRSGTVRSTSVGPWLSVRR
jgi:hypothetical protein